MKLTKQQQDELLARGAKLGPRAAIGSTKPRPRAGSMNKWEMAYAEHLRLLAACGEVTRFRFEAFKLRLAKRTWYTPDFLVVYATGVWELVDIKGFMRDDASVKLKVAAEQFPEFRFVIVRKVGKTFERTEIVP